MVSYFGTFSLTSHFSTCVCVCVCVSVVTSSTNFHLLHAPLDTTVQTGPADNLEDISAQLTILPFSVLSSDDLELFLDLAIDLTAEGGNDSQVSGKEGVMNCVWLVNVS